MSVNNTDWLQAQCSVLGSALIEPTLVPKVIQLTRSADFSGPCHTIYTAMRNLFQNGSPVDVVSLANAMGAEYRDYLRQLMEITPTASNLDYYIQLCREQAKVASARDIASRISAAENSDDIRKLLDEANGLMVDKPALRITTMSDALKSFMERHSGTVSYIKWPINELNDRLYAEQGDFILIGGRPSTGKSAFSLQCGWHWATADTKVGFFSLETSSAKLFDRKMSGEAGISMDDIKRNKISAQQWERIASMSPQIISRNIELVEAAGFGPADIRSVTMMRGYKIIIIDYVQLLQASGSNRTEQVTNISLALHRMAQDMQVTIVALSQLKRKSDDSTPDNSDLRESGQLEQDADIIMQLTLENKDQPDGNRELYITKNKEGTCPKIVLAFDGKHQTFKKADRTGQLLNEMVQKGKAAQKASRKAVRAEPQRDENQFTLLPDSTDVPFK